MPLVRKKGRRGGVKRKGVVGVWWGGVGGSGGTDLISSSSVNTQLRNLFQILPSFLPSTCFFSRLSFVLSLVAHHKLSVTRNHTVIFSLPAGRRLCVQTYYSTHLFTSAIQILSFLRIFSFCFPLSVSNHSHGLGLLSHNVTVNQSYFALCRPSKFNKDLFLLIKFKGKKIVKVRENYQKKKNSTAPRGNFNRWMKTFFSLPCFSSASQ